MWPGAVRTEIISRSDNSPWWIKGITPIIHFLGFSASPDAFVAVAIYAASALARDDEGFKALCLNEKARPIPVSVAAEDGAVRESVWAKLEEMIHI